MFSYKTRSAAKEPKGEDSKPFKIPVEALLKRANTEIGQLKAYISELEDLKLRYRKKVLECYDQINQLKGAPKLSADEAREIFREIKRDGMVRQLINDHTSLTKRIHELKVENERLLERIIKYEKLLLDNGINPRQK